MIHSKLTWRAIDYDSATWLGMAPAMAGGFIAVNGPYVELVTVQEYEQERSEAFDRPTNREYAEHLAARLRRCHRRKKRSEGYFRIAEEGTTVPSRDRAILLVMVVPRGNLLAERGLAIPRALQRELIPLFLNSGISFPHAWTAADVRAWVERHGGNVTACARRLGVGRTQLQAWLAEEDTSSARELPRYVQAHMETLDRNPENPASW